MLLVSRTSLRLLCSAALATLGLVILPGSARAASQIMNYSLPAAWSSGTVVTDQSPAHNDGSAQGAPALSSNIPSGAASGTNSLTSNAGGFQTTNTALLANPALATNGGFSMETWFNWDGTSTRWATQKIIDYSGTDGLQLFNPNGANQTAGEVLQFGFNGNTDPLSAISMPILPNTWYHVLATFNSGSNAVAGDGSLAGIATLSLDTGGVPLTASLPITKTTAGDALNRPLAVGILAFPATHLVTFNGQIYNPVVSLGVVPEPASLSLLALAAPAFMRRRRA